MLSGQLPALLLHPQVLVRVPGLAFSALLSFWQPVGGAPGAPRIASIMHSSPGSEPCRSMGAGAASTDSPRKGLAQA